MNTFVKRTKDLESYRSMVSPTIYNYNLKYNPYDVADGWFTFSSFMPNLLIEVSMKLKSNIKKKRILKIALEELGEGEKFSHDVLFLNSCKKIHYTPKIIDLRSLSKLKRSASMMIDDRELLGLSFGMEFTAIENIEFLFQKLSYGEEEDLRNTRFFQIHFANEEEHIAENYKNLENYIQSNDDFSVFYRGVKVGMAFWKEFWNELKY
ncbi:MAG: hypothetical protein CMJ16_00565 [Peredibacter sp.]|nr:hypothetical protein [Peredibacter sp.]